ncbi:unnamed protein product [Musa banksii]
MDVSQLEFPSHVRNITRWSSISCEKHNPHFTNCFYAILTLRDITLEGCILTLVPFPGGCQYRSECCYCEQLCKPELLSTMFQKLAYIMNTCKFNHVERGIKISRLGFVERKS